MTGEHPGDEVLQAWLEQSLPQSEADCVSSHLQGCADCRRLADDYRFLFSALSAAPEIALTADFCTRTAACGLVVYRRRLCALAFLQTAAYGAAMAVLLTAGAFFINPSSGLAKAKETLIGAWYLVAKSMQNLMTDLQLDWALFLFSLLALGLIAVIDRSLSQRQESFFLA
ncbi:MAG TPA: hypothetical protein PKN04_12270 [bacterium]|nr:hypothetical protein [bacterium]